MDKYPANHSTFSHPTNTHTLTVWLRLNEFSSSSSWYPIPSCISFTWFCCPWQPIYYQQHGQLWQGTATYKCTSTFRKVWVTVDAKIYFWTRTKEYYKCGAGCTVCLVSEINNALSKISPNKDQSWVQAYATIYIATYCVSLSLVFAYLLGDSGANWWVPPLKI